MNEPIKFKAIRKKTVEEVVESEGGSLHIKGIIIGGKKYDLDINNGSLGDDKERLVLDFNDSNYKIIIENEGIRFERTRYRKDHDHDDLESLQTGSNDSNGFIKKGELVWISRFPYSHEGREFFRIPFGPVYE